MHKVSAIGIGLGRVQHTLFFWRRIANQRHARQHNPPPVPSLLAFRKRSAIGTLDIDHRTDVHGVVGFDYGGDDSGLNRYDHDRSMPLALLVRSVAPYGLPTGARLTTTTRQRRCPLPSAAFRAEREKKSNGGLFWPRFWPARPFLPFFALF